jgi:HK97 family phage portal protein
VPVLIDTDGDLLELGADPGIGDRPFPFMSMPFSLWDGDAFFGGRPVSYAKVFATQPWIAIAVMRLMTWAVRVPLKLYRRTATADSARERLMPGDHPLASALVDPWPRGSQADLVMNMLGPLCVHGNGLINVESGSADSMQFKAIDWRYIQPILVDQLDPRSEILGWKVWQPEGGYRTVTAEDMLHLRWWSPIGPMGISPIRQVQGSVIAEAAAVDWTVNNLEQGVRPTGVVEFDDATLQLEAEMRRELYETAVKDLEDEHAGPQKAGKGLVLPPGMKWSDSKPTTAVEAELIAQRMVNRNEVAAIYMLPPPMIGQLERSTYNNITTLREISYTDGLAPPLVLIEQTINAHIIRGLLKEPDLFVEFDFGLILRGDRLKEIQALRQGIMTAIYTPNEARGALNMPKSDEKGADELWLPTNNLAPLSSVADGQGGASKATKTPPVP